MAFHTPKSHHCRSLLKLPVCMWACVCVWVYIHMFDTCLCVCTCGGERLKSGVVLGHLYPTFEKASYWTMSSLTQLCCLASELPSSDPLVPVFPELGLQACTAVPAFLCGSWELKHRSLCLHTKHFTCPQAPLATLDTRNILLIVSLQSLLLIRLLGWLAYHSFSPGTCFLVAFSPSFC